MVKQPSTVVGLKSSSIDGFDGDVFDEDFNDVFILIRISANKSYSARIFNS